MRKTVFLLLLVLCLSLAANALAVSALSYGMLEPVDAAPNQKLALRSGPGTKYTEIFTISPAAIDNFAVYEQVKGGSVMWGMVEFDSGYGRYRVYTGMKRIDARGNAVPVGNTKGVKCTVGRRDVQAYYGPGWQYAPVKGLVPAHTEIIVYHEEQGYVMADFRIPDDNPKLTRAWIEVDALSGYERSDWTAPWEEDGEAWDDWELSADELG